MHQMQPRERSILILVARLKAIQADFSVGPPTLSRIKAQMQLLKPIERAKIAFIDLAELSIVLAGLVALLASLPLPACWHQLAQRSAKVHQILH